MGYLVGFCMLYMSIEAGIKGNYGPAYVSIAYWTFWLYLLYDERKVKK